MYFDYKNEYNEDDFFYHMYFDEVSTTPLPDEFYDILHSVSGGNKPPVVESLDYASLLGNRNIGHRNISTADITAAGTAAWAAAGSAAGSATGSEDETAGDTIATLSDVVEVATDPAPAISVTQFNVGRNITQFGRKAARIEANKPPRSARNSKRTRWRRHAAAGRRRDQRKKDTKKSKQVNSAKKQKLKWTMSSKEKRKKGQQAGKKKKKKQDPRIVGILDLRVPANFKTNFFVPILLESFIVLSTGVAPAGRIVDRFLGFDSYQCSCDS